MTTDGADDADGLSGSEQYLLDLIRDGRVDAEIAVRLAVPLSDVRERTARLAAKLGVVGREGLLALNRGREADITGGVETATGWRPPTWVKSAIASAIVLCLALAAIAAITRWRGDDDDGRFAVLIDVQSPGLGDEALETALAVEIHRKGSPLGPIVTAEGNLDEASPLFSTQQSDRIPVLGVAGGTTEAITAQLSTEAFIRTGGPLDWTVVGPVTDGVRLAGLTGTTHVVVTVTAMPGSRLVDNGLFGIAIRNDSVGESPRVRVSVTDNLNRPLALDLSSEGSVRVWPRPLRDH